MAEQTYKSTLAARLGDKITQAHNQHRDAAVDRGMVRLPAGIRAGKAKITACYIGQYKDDVKRADLRGQEYFRVSATVMHPESHGAQRVKGLVTSMMVPLCDEAARGNVKAKSFSDNWFEFQNFFKMFKVQPPPAGTPSAGIMTYYTAAMKMLVDPKKPRYVEFSTRGWTPPATAQQPKPEEMVFEEWHDETQWVESGDPVTNGVVDTGASPPPVSTTMGPRPFTEPPQAGDSPVAETPAEPQDVADVADMIAALIEVADLEKDPEKATPEGVDAQNNLIQLAKDAGATDEQITNATSWAEVGEMALGVFPEAPAAPVTTTPTVGSKVKFKKRDSKGQPLQNAKKETLPAVEVTVASVDAAARTLTATSADGKSVVDIRTKKPLAVSFDWLE